MTASRATCGRQQEVSFSVVAPVGREIPVVVEVPHAGLDLDPLALAGLVAPARCLGVDADLYVDALYADAPAEGATLLSARLSRYVCDLNRGEEDVDPLAVTGGRLQRAPHGLVWRDTTTGARALRQPLSRSEYERRLNQIYRPYHQKLRSLLDEKRERFGYVILLAAHSMPSRGRQGHTDTGRVRAHVVPGSRGRSTAAPIIVDTPEALAATRGWSVAHDNPYRGGFTTWHYGQPASGQHALQVELSRALYMDEDTLEKKDTFWDTRQYCRELVRSLGALPPEPLLGR